MKSRARKRKRRSHPLKNLAVFLIAVLFVATALTGLYRCFSHPPGFISAFSAAKVNSDQPQEPDIPANQKEHFYNILVCGLDNENGGSDTNLLLALDAENGTLDVLSLPRDTLLNVSWSVKKLNNAYHHGGASQVQEEVSRLLGVPIHYCVTVDLEAFVKLVDAINGVEFEVPVDMDYDDPAQDLHIHFEKGQQRLDGEDALKVVRWRKNNDGSGYPTADIGRIGTQQAFLKAAAQQALRPSNWGNIPHMAQILQTYVDTGELTLPNLIWFGEQILTIGSDNIRFHTLPGDGAGYYKKVSYYVLYPEETLALVNQYFNPYTYDLSPDDQDILVP